MSHLHQELDLLRARLLEMAEAVDSLVTDAVVALLERDFELAREVIDADKIIDQLEIEVDETTIRLIALYQPVAADLRILLNAQRIGGTLERIGDLARRVAKTAIKLGNSPIPGGASEILRLAQMSQAMVRDAMRSFTTGDPALARDVCRRDDEVDALRDQVHISIVEEMRKDSSFIDNGLLLVLATRNLERIADLATNISEDVVHIVQGVIIKHNHEELAPASQAKRATG